MSGRAARADFGADHAMHHQGVTIPPGGEKLVNIDEHIQQTIGLVKHGFVTIKADQQRCVQSFAGQSPQAFLDQFIVLVFVK